jgi:hypothetical protein
MPPNSKKTNNNHNNKNIPESDYLEHAKKAAEAMELQRYLYEVRVPEIGAKAIKRMLPPRNYRPPGPKYDNMGPMMRFEKSIENSVKEILGPVGWEAFCDSLHIGADEKARRCRRQTTEEWALVARRFGSDARVWDPFVQRAVREIKYHFDDHLGAKYHDYLLTMEAKSGREVLTDPFSHMYVEIQIENFMTTWQSRRENSQSKQFPLVRECIRKQRKGNIALDDSRQGYKEIVYPRVMSRGHAEANIAAFLCDLYCAVVLEKQKSQYKICDKQMGRARGGLSQKDINRMGLILHPDKVYNFFRSIKTKRPLFVFYETSSGEYQCMGFCGSSVAHYSQTRVTIEDSTGEPSGDVWAEFNDAMGRAFGVLKTYAKNHKK